MKGAKEIMVEGFKVIIEDDENGGFVLSVPELPGCIGMVRKEEDAEKEMKKLILSHLLELAKKMPRLVKKDEQPPKRGSGRKKNIS